MPRPKGLPKSGGRKAGTPNKNHRVRDRHEAMIRGMTPLEYLLGVMRDESAELHRRDEAAKAAAPFVHPRRVPETAAGNTSSTVTLVVNCDPLCRPIE